MSLGESLDTFTRGRDRPKLRPVPRRETFPFLYDGYSKWHSLVACCDNFFFFLLFYFFLDEGEDFFNVFLDGARTLCIF